MRYEPDTADGDPVNELYFHTLPSTRLRIIEPARFTRHDVAAYLASNLPGELAAEVDVPAGHDLTRGLPLAVQLFANLLHRGVPPDEAVREVSPTGDVSGVLEELGLGSPQRVAEERDAEQNFPDYRDVVHDELESLKTEVRSSAPAIRAAGVA